MEDIRRQICSDFSQGIAGKRDEQIRFALNASIGHDHWTIAEINGRIHRVIMAGVETYFLDDRPILEIHPVTFEASDDGMKIVAKWNVRTLNAANKQQG